MRRFKCLNCSEEHKTVLDKSLQCRGSPSRSHTHGPFINSIPRSAGKLQIKAFISRAKCLTNFSSLKEIISIILMIHRHRNIANKRFIKLLHLKTNIFLFSRPNIFDTTYLYLWSKIRVITAFPRYTKTTQIWHFLITADNDVKHKIRLKSEGCLHFVKKKFKRCLKFSAGGKIKFSDISSGLQPDRTSLFN